MESHKLRVWNGEETICIDNAFLVEFTHKMPKKKLQDCDCEMYEPMGDIEVVLRFKAPFFEKTGKENAFTSKKKFKPNKLIKL